MNSELSAKQIIGYSVFAIIMIAILLKNESNHDANATLKNIHHQVAADAMSAFDLAIKANDQPSACVQAGIVTASFLQAGDDTNYRQWLGIKGRVCH